MYNARVFYNLITGDVYRSQTVIEGGAIPINDDIELTSNLFEVSVEQIGVLEWATPDNDLELVMAEGKCVAVDISTNPPTVYGKDAEVVEPSEDDEISGSEFLAMVEEVL